MTGGSEGATHDPCRSEQMTRVVPVPSWKCWPDLQKSIFRCPSSVLQKNILFQTCGERERCTVTAHNSPYWIHRTGDLADYSIMGR